MSNLSWAEARPMLYAIRGLARVKGASGATLNFDGYYGKADPLGNITLYDEHSNIVFTQPVDWPISQARGGGPDPNQLTLDDAEKSAEAETAS